MRNSLLNPRSCKHKVNNAKNISKSNPPFKLKMPRLKERRSNLRRQKPSGARRGPQPSKTKNRFRRGLSRAATPSSSNRISKKYKSK